MYINVFSAKWAKDVADLIVPIQQIEFGVEITIQDQPDLQNIGAFYQTGKGGFWVARHNQQVIGTIALKDIGNDETALRKMFVHENYRGSNKGVAKALLETLLAHATTSKVRTVYLGTTEKYQAAHRFYEKNGFEHVQESALPASFPKMDVDSKFYKKHLK